MVLYSVIMFIAALLFLALGIAIYRGNTKLIMEQHQEKVKDPAAYGRDFSKSMFLFSLTFFLSGLLAAFGKEADGPFSPSLIILAAGMVLSLAALIRTQKKHNGGLF